MPGPHAGEPRRHVLILTDRDWTHPQGGGTGTSLYGQVSRWVAWGHRVTVVAGTYPGAAPVERLAEHLVVHRMGSRLTVFPRAAWATLRGLARDADVVLEVVNGIAFLSPLWPWLRAPTVPLVHHVHREHYVAELGLRGRVAAFWLERVPLRLLLRHLPCITISQATHDELVALGVPSERVHVAYLGVEEGGVRGGPRADVPTLLYLGRLKAYKRIETALDVLEAAPEGTRLEIAGDGDHRAALEAEIARRGLGDRVTLHGFVEEDDKADLYARAWLTLTASSAEGWCLTVMEAAACGTPSAALRVGGLAESIVDGETGILAETREELAARVHDALADRDELERLGETARARARGFTWEHTAERNLAVLERAAEDGHVPLTARMRRSGTLKAAGLAGAALAGNAIAVIVTVAFTRLLGKEGYGSLAALVSAFTILAVVGSSLQVAVARETALGRLGSGARLASTLRTWTRTLLIALVALTIASVVARDAIAAAVGVPDEPWAAAGILPTGVTWLLLSLQRGVLQGVHAYRPVGWSIILEALGRLVCGALLVLAGADVAGAFLGTPLSMAICSLVLAASLARRLGAAEGGRRAPTLRSLMATGWAPVAGLFLLAALQNIDIIVAKHQMTDDAAGAYAAAIVAAKLLVWVAIGIGLYLLPEATRRFAAGDAPRPVLLRALGILALVAVPALAIFALAPELLLRVAFGPEFTQAADALVVLGAAMGLLAVANLAVQYMLALGRTAFLWVLGVVAIAEPFLLSADDFGLVSFAAVVLGLQCVAASVSLALGLRARPAPAGAA